MGTGKVAGNRVHRNPNDFSKPLGPNQTTKQKHSKDDKSKKNQKSGKKIDKTEVNEEAHPATASEQLSFLLGQYQSANGIQLSSLELESIKDTCILETSPTLSQDVMNLAAHLKAAVGKPWKEVLCEGQLFDGKIDPGSPAVLIISTSALRSIELLKGTRKLTSECYAAKLFSKHMKVEEQEAVLKGRVNIASGTPSRIKKLIDIEALGLSRLKIIVLDMFTDVKGYSLFSLPQVRDEFWDLYKNYIHPRLVEGEMRICLYGPLKAAIKFNDKKKAAKNA